MHRIIFMRTRATNEAPITAPPAEGFMTEVAQSKFVKNTREEALNNLELEETNVAQGETKKMNMFQSINDAMRIALDTDDTAGRIKDLSNGKFLYILNALVLTTNASPIYFIINMIG
ncbi:thiamine diphosphate-binding protein [Gigaspora margarita]|uniref:Thiamine diphosphate-binding protein n=1 Tax=Gigaspora margarita TaxID=4874 RepID=A0A8H4AKW9_GIGMA|nr:thiamine diphosphate-binding protein [Gigaspora margarita]